MILAPLQAVVKRTNDSHLEILTGRTDLYKVLDWNFKVAHQALSLLPTNTNYHLGASWSGFTIMCRY